MEVVAPMFSEQLNDLEQLLNSVRGDFQDSNFSADATLILDRLAMNISTEIFEARFDLMRARQELDTTILREVGSEITALRSKTDELRNLAGSARAATEDL